ncbi:hypothetical protein [Bacillus thuringiensis]|uniref:hypothetical protein n=1 Tax=Bacillus cereus group TaxID=86661 RepID=UPI0020CCF2BB|nr:hypothetical protein [Bacillus thuringiensis]MDA2491353.1 hypothetical protein [Bacillus cereus]
MTLKFYYSRIELKRTILYLFFVQVTQIITNINNLKTPSKRKSPEHIDGFVAMLIGHKETLNMMENTIPDEGYDEYLDDIYR